MHRLVLAALQAIVGAIDDHERLPARRGHQDRGHEAAADGKLVMNMRDADIRALIQWVADVTGKNLVVHKDVQGKVTVLSSEPLTSAEAYQVFLATLEVHGFAAIERAAVVRRLVERGDDLG